MKISRAKLRQIIREETAKLEEEDPLEENEDPLEEGGLGDDLEDDESGAESYYHRTDRPQDVGGRSNLGGRERGDSYRYQSPPVKKDPWAFRDKDPGPYQEGLNKKLTKEAVKRLVKQVIKEMNK